MSHTKSGCDLGAAAEVGAIGEQVASERNELATCNNNNIPYSTICKNAFYLEFQLLPSLSVSEMISEGLKSYFPVGVGHAIRTRNAYAHD